MKVDFPFIKNLVNNVNMLGNNQINFMMDDTNLTITDNTVLTTPPSNITVGLSAPISIIIDYSPRNIDYSYLYIDKTSINNPEAIKSLNKIIIDRLLLELEYNEKDQYANNMFIFKITAQKINYPIAIDLFKKRVPNANGPLSISGKIQYNLSVSGETFTDKIQFNDESKSTFISTEKNTFSSAGSIQWDNKNGYVSIGLTNTILTKDFNNQKKWNKVFEKWKNLKYIIIDNKLRLSLSYKEKDDEGYMFGLVYMDYDVIGCTLDYLTLEDAKNTAIHYKITPQSTDYTEFNFSLDPNIKITSDSINYFGKEESALSTKNSGDSEGRFDLIIIEYANKNNKSDFMLILKSVFDNESTAKKLKIISIDNGEANIHYKDQLGNYYRFDIIEVFTPNDNEDFKTALKYYFSESEILPKGSGAIPKLIGRYFGDDFSNNMMQILTWDTRYVTDMSFAFYSENLNSPKSRGYFNHDISSWNTSNVTNMESMFEGNKHFFYDISKWDVSKVKNMKNMFKNADYNKKLEWDIGSVDTFANMFDGATKYYQNIRDWNPKSSAIFENMFKDAVLIQKHYSGFPGWLSGNTPTIEFFSIESIHDPLFFIDSGKQYIGQITKKGSLSSNNTAIHELFVDFDTDIIKQGIIKGKSNGIDNTKIFTYNQSKKQIYTKDLEYNINNSNLNVQLELYDTINETSPQVKPIAKLFISISIVDSIFYPKNSDEFEVGLKYYFDESQNLPLNSNGNHSGLNAVGRYSDLKYRNKISFWNVEKVTNMETAFTDKINFNEDISNWNVGKVTNMSSMFLNTASFNQDIRKWNVENVADFSFMFSGAISFNNGDINDDNKKDMNTWNTKNVKNMTSMFKNAQKFNQNIGNWNVEEVTNMFSMFENAFIFNSSINKWNAKNIRSFNSMFMNAKKFNEELTDFNFGSSLGANTYIDMGNMFYGAEKFNNNGNKLDGLNKWNMKKVLNIENMFYGATNFNQSIEKWHINDKLVSFKGLFFLAKNFDKDIKTQTFKEDSNEYSAWDTKNITNMDSVFKGATLFSQSIDNWDVSSVNTFNEMFSEAENFYQNIRLWNPDSNAIFTEMFNQSPLMIEHFYGVPGWNDLNKSTPSIEFFSATNTTTEPVVNIIDNTIYNGLITNDIHDSSENMHLIKIRFDPTLIKHIEILGNDKDLFKHEKNKILSKKEFFFNFNDNSKNSYNISLVLYVDDDKKKPIDTIHLSISVKKGIFIPKDNESFIMGLKYYFGESNAIPKNEDNKYSGLVEIGRFNNSEHSKEISFWNTKNITTMKEAFKNKIDFNEDIGSWDTKNVIDMSSMFENAKNFNQSINEWIVDNVTDMSNMFKDAIRFNKELTKWNTSNLLDISGMFMNAQLFNNGTSDNLNNFDVSKVKNMSYVFSNSKSFNKDISKWDTKSATTFSHFFHEATNFNQDINLKIMNDTKRQYFAWDTHNVKDMSYMFDGAKNFNKSISRYITTSVTNMQNMFANTDNFDSPIKTLITSTSLNNSLVNILAWDMSNVKTTAYMFENSKAFNQNIGNWNLKNVESMDSMFKNAEKFNQNISRWDVGKVIEFKEMFMNSESFFQNTRFWNVNDGANLTDMFYADNDNSLIIDEFRGIPEWQSGFTPLKSFFNLKQIFFDAKGKEDSKFLLIFSNKSNSITGGVFIENSFDRLDLVKSSSNKFFIKDNTLVSRDYLKFDYKYSDNNIYSFQIHAIKNDITIEIINIILTVEEIDLNPKNKHRKYACYFGGGSGRGGSGGVYCARPYLDSGLFGSGIANQFSGSYNRPNNLLTKSMRYSSLLKNYSHRTSIAFLSPNLNAFGKWGGAPGGSGSKLKNLF